MYTQDDRFISIQTPLGKDTLLLKGFSGQEGISRLFQFQLDLLSEDHSIAFEKIIGEKITLSVALADGSTRYFNGYVSRFAETGGDARFTYYQAEMVPWLWFLTRTSDCRVFQRQTVPDIIEDVFSRMGFHDFENLTQGFKARDYCVQYRESAFTFVSRLMEHYGIFYFFKHERDKHTLVFANDPSAHPVCEQQPSVRWDYTPGRLLDEDVLTNCRLEQELHAGKCALSDFNFETPSTSLLVNAPSMVKVGRNEKYEKYDFPGEYLKKVEGDPLVKIRMQEEEARHLQLTGTSTCRAFAAGFRFDLKEHPRHDMNKTYLLTELRHEASVGQHYPVPHADPTAEGSYSNQFTAIPYAVPFRPQRITPRPIIPGVQTAIVTGKSGDEILVDKYGRVKVQFHWDREGKHDENSSCWVRVSQAWTGRNWGHIANPHVGEEVIISFIEGNPDHPIIVGRLYNAAHMPPYPLPENASVIGMKSESTRV